MFLANLSLVEFFALLAAAWTATVALYLLSRSRRRLTVATLRFWQNAAQAVQQKRRRRVDQPWSLVLQLLTVLCLLLAMAQPRWGTRIFGGRDHILLLDTSAWMAAPGHGGDLSARAGSAGELSEEARRAALRWLRTLPSQDRVMVIRAGSQAVPVTRFESSRAELQAAIRGSIPTAGALDLEQALSLARQAQRLEGRQPGEIAYAGAARLASDPAALQLPQLPLPARLRAPAQRRFRLRRPATPARRNRPLAGHLHAAQLRLAAPGCAGGRGARRLPRRRAAHPARAAGRILRHLRPAHRRGGLA